MKTEELKAIVANYWSNYNRTDSERIPGSDMADRLRHGVATVATIIDYLRGDIKGLTPKVDDKVSHSPVDANTDPNPTETEAMKQLGTLGVQSLEEIKGWKLDTQKHFLLYINNRFADTGWIEGDPHIKALSDVLTTFGLSIEEMK